MVRRLKDKYKHYYSGICTYSTVCKIRFPAYGIETKEEAENYIRETFDKWNKNWVRDGGNPKELISIEIEG